MLFFVTLSKLIAFVLFYYVVAFNPVFFSLTRNLLFPCAYVSIESIHYIDLSSFELKAILLISSVKGLCYSLLNLYSVFIIKLLFLMSSL